MTELKPFKREERYIVVKLKDLHSADANVSAALEKAVWDFLDENEIPTRECAVVERDWPEYETVWQMIEARVTGNHRPGDEALARKVLEAAAGCQPSTAQDPNEDAYQRCRFDAVMEFQRAIKALNPAEILETK